MHTDRADYQDGSMPPVKRWFAEATNPEQRDGAPNDVIDGTDLFVGLSGARVMDPKALERMNRDAMVFAMANPNPEITPEEAAPYARVIATGRSDYPNQINNVLCFPGIFRGALDVRARDITEEMKMAAAHGIASIVADDELREDYVIPSVFNRDVARRGRAGRRRPGQGPGHRRGDRQRGRLLARRDRGIQSRPALSAVPRHMRVTITGASGLIGTKLAAALTQRGDEVTKLSLRKGPPDPAAPRRPRRDRAPGGRAGRPALERRHPQGDPRVARAGHAPTRARRSRNADPKPKALISSSAVGYYGPHGDERWTRTRRPATTSSPRSAWPGSAKRTRPKGYAS